MAAGVETGFGLDADTSHGLDTFNWENSVRGFSTQHDTISTIKNCVGDIGCLSSGRSWIFYHCFHHLSGNYDRFSGGVTLIHHKFLGDKHLGSGDLHSEVTSGDHDPVGSLKNVVEVFETLLVFDLGNDLNILSSGSEEVSDGFDIIRRPGEAQGDNIDVLLQSEFDDIYLVLLSNGREINLAPWQIHVFSFSDRGIVFYLDDDTIRKDRLDFANKLTISDKNLASFFYGSRK